MPDNVYTDADYDAACQAVEDAKLALAEAEHRARTESIRRLGDHDPGLVRHSLDLHLAIEDAKVVLALAEREAYAAFISRYDAKVEQNRS
jgi:3-methyladenine DNA glycosylase Tag